MNSINCKTVRGAFAAFVITGCLFAGDGGGAGFANAGQAQKKLAEHMSGIRDWTRAYAITAIAETCGMVDEKFAGVRAMSPLLKELDYNNYIDVEAVLYSRDEYWRGVMEMVGGNHLVACIPVLLHAVNGELDRADNLLQLLAPFENPSSDAHRFLKELNARSQAARDVINSETKRGIAFHDQGKYDEAIAVYEQLLQEAPRAVAWVRYELFFSQFFKRIAAKGTVTQEGLSKGMALHPALWMDAAKEIYRINPLYTSQFSAKRGESMGAIFDRLALAELSKSGNVGIGTKYGSYADYAVRLGDYALAAHAYWLSLRIKNVKGPGFSGEESQLISTDEILTRYLYCLEKLGATGIRKNFKKEFSAEFEKMDEELLKHRTQ